MASHHGGINPHAASDLLRQVMHQKYVTVSYIFLFLYTFSCFGFEASSCLGLLSIVIHPTG